MTGGPRPPSPWLFTFADLAALLLAFFVLTFSMSRLDAERWHRLAAGWTGRETTVPSPPSRPDHSAPERRSEEAVGEAAYLARVLDRRLETLGRPFAIRAQGSAGAVVLAFDPDLLGSRTPRTEDAVARLRAVLLPALSDVVELRLLAPVPDDLPLAERLRRLRSSGEVAGARLGRLPDRVLAAAAEAPVRLVLVP